MKKTKQPTSDFQNNINVSQLLMAGLPNEAEKIAKSLPLEFITKTYQSLKSIKTNRNYRRQSQDQKNCINMKLSMYKRIVNENYDKQSS